MAAVNKAHVVVDVEEGEAGRRSAVTDRRSYPESDSEGSEYEEKRRSSESGSEIVERESSTSDSSAEVDLEEVKIHVAKVGKDCRICHLSLDATNHESGIPIELGCSCKADLAAAHKQCAEACFKIKGNNASAFSFTTLVNTHGRDTYRSKLWSTLRSLSIAVVVDRRLLITDIPTWQIPC